jgi:ATP-dependent DNA ligase
MRANCDGGPITGNLATPVPRRAHFRQQRPNQPPGDNATKRWVYAGHVGTGFDYAMLKSLYGTMQPLRTDKKPFDQKVKDENATTWLIPKLVGEVKFSEWTSESEMRHPAFLGLRTDKKALDVIREQT